MGPSGPRVMARTKERITISAVTFFAVSLALLYHGGWCSSCISARIIASRKPANIPAKCPTKSTLGEMVDIMMHEVHIKANHKKILDRLSPNRSQVRRTSAAHTPSNPKPLVEAPTANFMGSTATEIRFPRKPQNMYSRQNLRRPNCFSMPKPIRIWKKRLKKICSAFACSIMGNIRRHTAPCAMAGPHEAPSRYNEQSFGEP
mmetsp:Transcript_59661/g.94422  ORF Transcript_59661/g.94422 Transcript_59661/m.94422 type:complete len:203 (-) Transcript_59661:489-1097(-)